MNLPNTCYRCHSIEHKTGDCPLTVSRVKLSPKDAPAKPAKGKQKEEWTTVGHKYKASLAPNKMYVVIFFVPAIQIGAQTSTFIASMIVSLESNLVDS